MSISCSQIRRAEEHMVDDPVSCQLSVASSDFNFSFQNRFDRFGK